DHQRLLVAEQILEVGGSLFAREVIVAGDFAARRQAAALFGHAFDVPAQFDFLGQKRLPRRAVVGALVGEMHGVAGSKFGGWNQFRFAHDGSPRNQSRSGAPSGNNGRYGLASSTQRAKEGL